MLLFKIWSQNEADAIKSDNINLDYIPLLYNSCLVLKNVSHCKYYFLELLPGNQET